MIVNKAYSKWMPIKVDFIRFIFEIGFYYQLYGYNAVEDNNNRTACGNEYK